MTTPPLLTLHTEYLDRLIPHPGASAGHWLVQDAIAEEVITWDRVVWGELIFTVGIEDYEFVVGYSVTDEVYLSRAAEVDVSHPDNPPPDPIEDDDRYPPLPDPVQQPAEFLRLVVDELNALHEASTRMVAVWPGTTGVPVPGTTHEGMSMVQRSEIEMQLYEAVKHTIRPTEQDLEAVMRGEQVPLIAPPSQQWDISFYSDDPDRNDGM